jgi:hypothetical protein
MPDGTEVPDIPAKGEAETQYRIIESNGNWAYEIVKRWWQS